MVRIPATSHRFRLPTAAELAILRELWTHEAATARDLHRALGKDCYTTTLTHLSNLYKKRLAERFFDGRAHVYRAKVEKWIVLTAVARHVRDTLFERSGMALALCALSDTLPDRASLESLKDVIRDIERRTRVSRHQTTTRPAASNSH
jgi:predicted transcriptional regulator